MTKIKLCGLSRPCDIAAANRLRPEYVGFVFAPSSKRYITPEQAACLKDALDPHIQAVGVFVHEDPETVARLLRSGVIDLAQLHGGEDEGYLKRLRALTGKPIIQAFRVRSAEDIRRAEGSTADPSCWTPAPARGRCSTGLCSGRSGGPIFWPAAWGRTM